MWSASNSSLIAATLELIAASKIVFAFAWNSSLSSSPCRSASTSSSTLTSSVVSDSATTSPSGASIASLTFLRSCEGVSSTVSSTTSSSVTSDSATTSSVETSSSATTLPSASDSAYLSVPPV